MKYINTKNGGFSIIEVLVVLVLFAAVTLIASQTVLTSLRGSRKSTAAVSVKYNLDYTIGVMERHIRNAKSVSSACNGTAQNPITFIDQEDREFSFFCNASAGYIASGSATTAYSPISSEEIELTACDFSCTGAGYPEPTTVNLSVEARAAGTSGVESSAVRSDTTVYIRNY